MLRNCMTCLKPALLTAILALLFSAWLPTALAQSGPGATQTVSKLIQSPSSTTTGTSSSIRISWITLRPQSGGGQEFRLDAQPSSEKSRFLRRGLRGGANLVHSAGRCSCRSLTGEPLRSRLQTSVRSD